MPANGPDRLIERLLNLFGPPTCDNPEDYLSEITASLAAYDWTMCMRIGDMVRDRCKFFPRPAELREFANEIAREHSRRNRKPDVVEPDLPPPSPESVARMRALIDAAKTSMSAHALRDTTQPTDWARGQRPGFEKMQRESRNHHLHRKPLTLTARSRAMTGEDGE